MGNPAGVKRDFEALEKRRMQAIGLLQKNDLNQSEVARRLHVCRQTVSRWADEFKAGGKPALKKAGRAGRKEDEIRRWRRVRWPAIKKSPPARAHDHLHRRKRSKPAAASLPHLVASRRHTRSAVQFQLEVVVGRGRDHLLQLLFPALSRHGEEPAGDRFPRSSAAAHLRTAADR